MMTEKMENKYKKDPESSSGWQRVITSSNNKDSARLLQLAHLLKYYKQLHTRSFVIPA